MGGARCILPRCLGLLQAHCLKAAFIPCATLFAERAAALSCFGCFLGVFSEMQVDLISAKQHG